MSTDEQEWATLEAVLGIAGVQVTGWQYQGTHTIRVRVKSKNEMGVCPDCSKVCTQEHDVGHEQLVPDLPMSGKRCWLIYRPRRYACKRCERTFVERVGWKSPDKTCYELKERFREIFNTQFAYDEAKAKLDDWMTQAIATGFSAMKTFVNTLCNWKESVLNYFLNRLNNGFAEGVNTKIKLILRRAFGFRKFESLRLHILVAFEPKSQPAISELSR